MIWEKYDLFNFRVSEFQHFVEKNVFLRVAQNIDKAVLEFHRTYPGCNYIDLKLKKNPCFVQALRKFSFGFLGHYV